MFIDYITFQSVKAGSSSGHIDIINYQTTQFLLDLIEHSVKRLGLGDTLNLLLIYHGDQYSNLWKSDLYFRPAVTITKFVIF